MLKQQQISPSLGHLNDIRFPRRYCGQKGLEYVNYEQSQAVCTCTKRGQILNHKLTLQCPQCYHWTEQRTSQECMIDSNLYII